MTDRDVFDEVIAERDALRQQLAETRDELEANRLCNRFTWKDRACKSERQVATLTEALETYGQHARDCKVGHARWIQEPRGNKPGVVAHDHPCTCGLSAALAAVRLVCAGIAHA